MRRDDSEERPFDYSLSYEIITVGDQVILRLEGELDTFTNALGASALVEAMKQVNDNLVIDMRGVTFLSSGGMSVLYESMKVMSQGVSLTIRPSAEVYRIFQLTGLKGVFNTEW